MPSKRLIPSLLLQGGRLVKGAGFGNYRGAGRPESTARAHNAQGADEILILDIEASRLRCEPDYETIRTVANECFMPLTVGGGITTLEIARKCMNAGADKLCVNAVALGNPDIIYELSHVFGSQAIVLAVDVIRSPDGIKLFDHRTGEPVGTPDVLDWIREGVRLGAGEIRLMAVDREGMREGMDLALLEQVRNFVNVPVIIEGGAGSLDHLDTALAAGADGVAVGTMLVFSDNNLVKIKRFLAQKGHDIRIA